MTTTTANTSEKDAIRQHRKPICNSQGHCIGYSDWKDGDGLAWWPHRVLRVVVEHTK